MTFRPGSDAEVAFTDNGRLTLIDLRSGKRRDLPPSPGVRGGYEFHPDGRRLGLVVQRNGAWMAQVRSLDSPRPEAEISLPAGLSGNLRSMTWSPDGRRLALACSDDQIHIWEIDGSRMLVLTGLHSGDLRIAFNHRGDLLASSGWEGVLRLWDPGTGRKLLSLSGGGQSVRFSPDDRYLSVQTGDEIQLLEVAPAARVPRADRTARPRS